GIREGELAVLVIGARGAGADVDFVVIVLARLLVGEAHLERVGVVNPGEAIGNGVDGAGRVRRIRTTVESREARHVNGRDTVLNQLALGEDVRIVDAHGGAVQEVGRIHGDIHVIEAPRAQQVV